MSLMRRLKNGITICDGREEFTLSYHTGDFHSDSDGRRVVPSYLLLAAVCRLRPLGGAAQRRAVVTEVAGRVHLVLKDHETQGDVD